MEELLTGNDLYNWRKINRLSQKELADRIDYSITTISHYECANKPLSKKLIAKIKAYDLELHPVPTVDKIVEKFDILKTYGLDFYTKVPAIRKELIKLLSVDVHKDGYEESILSFDLLCKILPYIVDLKQLALTDIPDDAEYRSKVNEVVKNIFKECMVFHKAKYHK